MYDAYLNESDQYNIYIENDSDPNKDDAYYENTYDLYQNDSDHCDIYHKNTFDSSLSQQNCKVLRGEVTNIKNTCVEINDKLHQS